MAPGRLPVASGTAPGMDLGPKLVPKQWVLWFFGPNWCQNSGFYGFLAPSGLKSLRLARTAPKRDWPDGPKITTPSGAGTAPGGAKTVGFIVFGAPGGPGSQKNSGFYSFLGPSGLKSLRCPQKLLTKAGLGLLWFRHSRILGTDLAQPFFRFLKSRIVSKKN